MYIMIVRRIEREPGGVLRGFCAMCNNEKKVCVGILYMGSVHLGVV